MNRVYISNEGFFAPEEGEVFFAEVPNKGIDRKVKTMISKDNCSCKKCVFHRGELGLLCWHVRCLDGHKQYTFRRVADGKI